MKDEILTWLTQTYEAATQRVDQVGEVFTDYFGESLVDVQKPALEEFIQLVSSLQVYQVVGTARLRGDQLIFNESVSIPVQKWEAVESLPCEEGLEGELFQIAKPNLEHRLQRWLSSNGLYIIVRFPKVTVTNENDASIDITELYARVGVACSGIMARTLRFFRAEYTMTQWQSGYAHSHLPSTALEWQSPCLGSGPIRNTQDYLQDNFDLDRWGLFCYELAKYVTVESLSGVPYIRLESVGTYGSASITFPYYRTSRLNSYSTLQTAFARYYIRTQKFNVAFTNGLYELGCDPVDFIVDITNCFISWVNRRNAARISRSSLSTLKDRGILGEYVIVNKKLCYPTRRNELRDVSALQGRELFRFKDHMVTLNITDVGEEESNNIVTLLNHDYVCCLLTRILKIINYRYGHKEERKDSNTENTARQKHQII